MIFFLFEIFIKILFLIKQYFLKLIFFLIYYHYFFINKYKFTESITT
jgi:hypothetical protein